MLPLNDPLPHVVVEPLAPLIQLREIVIQAQTDTKRQIDEAKRQLAELEQRMVELDRQQLAVERMLEECFARMKADLQLHRERLQALSPTLLG